MNIYVFGDSISKGVVFNEERGRYTFLKDSFPNLLSKAIDSGTATVKNFSKFGSTIEKGYDIFLKNVDQLEAGSICLFEFGGNDCDLDWATISTNPNIEKQPKVKVDEFTSIYSEMIKKAKEKGLVPMVLSLPPLVANRFFNWVSKDLNSDNILKFLGGNEEEIFKWHEGYNKAVLKLAEENHTKVIDIRSEFLKNSPLELTCIDGMHPNEKGHRLMLQTVEKSLF